MEFKRGEEPDNFTSESSQIHVAVSNSSCLNFLEDHSTIELVDEEIKSSMADPKSESQSTGDESSSEELIALMLCAASYYRDCVTVQLRLNETWEEFKILSLQIKDIPPGRGIRVAADNSKSYIATDILVDSNLNDGVSQLGFHLETEGGHSIIKLEYIAYQYTRPEEEQIVMARMPQSLREFEGEEESEYIRNYDIEEEENEEVKDLILHNKLTFTVDDGEDDVKENIQIWKPNFNGSKVPIKIFAEKAEKYEKGYDSNATVDILGFLGYNGFLDVGFQKNRQKQIAKQLTDTASSASRDLVVDQETMVETLKAFQKFNGFPETGYLTRQESEGVGRSRCGNRDTSYRQETETFTCIEANTEIVSDIARDHCSLDEDSVLDICTHFPNDHVQSTERRKDFVWKKGYYFEVDVDFRNSLKRDSHVGIAFNYDNSTRKSDFVFIQYETKNTRIVFSYGKFERGLRTVVAKIHVDKSLYLDGYQMRYRKFKIRLTVNSDASRRASVAVNGRRIFHFNTIMPTKSSVYLFTLGGKNYKNHSVKIFTSRICRRNIVNKEPEEKHSRQKRWNASGFKWYPNGGPITYAFANYSSWLGK